jgi:2-polyprenyl-3-methyl-5-hydroxy-6-metoxy-1,4-benzoquinol methylase
MSTLQTFWEDHYREVFARGDGWLDYSNERVQLQTFGACIEASGGVAGLVCLDVGSGQGQFARTLLGLGARVVAVDILPDVVAGLRARTAAIDWRCGNVLDPTFVADLPAVDRLFALEVLQCVPWRETLEALWTKVKPGGRLLAVVPNGDCPIVRRTIERFEQHYSAPSAAELARALGALPSSGAFAIRGFTFQPDQRRSPYEVSSWTSSPSWAAPPNRLQFVVLRSP